MLKLQILPVVYCIINRVIHRLLTLFVERFLKAREKFYAVGFILKVCNSWFRLQHFIRPFRYVHLSFI